jgi:hypothetical protein
MFPIHFFNNKTCNWSIGFLQIVNISKLYHILGSNHSTFYLWSFQVSFPYKFLVLKIRILLLIKYMWKTITFHCLPSSRWLVSGWVHSINEIHVENDYFPLPSKFKMTSLWLSSQYLYRYLTLVKVWTFLLDSLHSIVYVHGVYLLICWLVTNLVFLLSNRSKWLDRIWSVASSHFAHRK